MKRFALVIVFCSISCVWAWSQIPLTACCPDPPYATSENARPSGLPVAGLPDSLFPAGNARPVNPLPAERRPAAVSCIRIKDLFVGRPYPEALEYTDAHALEPLSAAIPATSILYGVVALRGNALRTLDVSTAHEIEEDDPGFHTHLDNYLQFSPAAAVIGLNIAGIRGEHDFTDELCIYAVSSVITAATVWSVKSMAHEQRPDHSSFNSFPSGHTATAFASAEWLREEYPHSPWAAAAGYAAAATTGALRVYNNRHWVSDVIAGAAFGFLSTRIAYALNPWMERHILEPLRGRRSASDNRETQ
jgi:hypothetical protein